MQSLAPTTLAALTADFNSTPLVVLAAVFASLFGVLMVVNVVGYVFGTVLGTVFGVIGLVGRGLGRIGLFAGKQVQDSLHLAGGILTSTVLVPMAVANAAIGRFGNAGYYGRAFRTELIGSGASLYRVALGNPVWFLGLGALTDGLERRLPDLVSHAPASARPPRAPERRRRDPGQKRPTFEGYEVTGELEPGGSGARLYLAHPSDAVLARYKAAGHADPGQVVLKSFDLTHGSTMPQIVRESRSLEAARSLGLVLDHELNEASFWYVMPYVPGDDLDRVTRQLHAHSTYDGLSDRGLSRVMGYTSDLLASLSRFHRAGLWHKDIKPSNLIISGERAHLVDLGLVTPLASAMTLTTHGTEYFRDPELVRMAMRGVRVQDVDGVKFDLYSAGAVLFSMVENSFPAHGNLSRVAKRCPDALAFIIRRAMADLSQRYVTADEMNRDLDVLIAARDPWAVKPADLPSMSAQALPRAAHASHAAHGGEPFTLGVDAPPVRPVPPPVARKASLAQGPAAGVDDSARAAGRHSATGWVAAAALAFLMLGGMTFLARTAWSRAHDQLGPSVSVTRVESPRASVVSRTANHDLDMLGAAGRVLVLASAGTPQNDPQIVNLRQVLDSRGHTLVGLGHDSSSIELIARARQAAGLSELTDPRAQVRLQEFVDEVQGVDALIWLGPSRGDKIGYEIFVRGDR